ncbi:Shedu immune nuclease family protein [Agrobacterium pusense]|uniref:Shedu immune nuclease family protein n=1 Tax=Agrobacterium pusense TaxID=648995 RepID=UPI003FD2F88E
MKLQWQVIRTLLSSRFLAPKYATIQSIVVDDMEPLSTQDFSPSMGISGLPTGLVKDPMFGFGLTNDLRFVVQAVEKVPGIQELFISKVKGLSRNGATLRITRAIFGNFRKTISRLHRTTLDFANQRKFEFVDANIAAMLDPNFSIDYDRDTGPDLAERLAEKLVGKTKTGEVARKAAIRTAKASVATIVKSEPSEILSLQREIETVTLEELIDRMERKIGQKSLTESDWQSFLSENAFILRLAFGVPALIFEEQLAVGGTRFDGGGGKLADYALRAGLLGNLAIVEIKTPTADLVERKSYRGDLHAPTKELSGAVSQVLDQRYRLQMDIKGKKIDSEVYDVYTYAVQCVVIAGLVPETEPMRKSFELYRSNLKDVVVLTFDELVAKLRALLNFLKGSSR